MDGGHGHGNMGQAEGQGMRGQAGGHGNMGHGGGHRSWGHGPLRQGITGPCMVQTGHRSSEGGGHQLGYQPATGDMCLGGGGRQVDEYVVCAVRDVNEGCVGGRWGVRIVVCA